MTSFLLALGGCALFCLGAHVAAAGEYPFLADLPSVLTPSRFQQSQNEAPAAVTVIDRALIRATGWLADNLVPYFTQTG